ncbi:hypothetical protein BH09PSE5_BH09PSE5_49180 [soil metagenome]
MSQKMGILAIIGGGSVATSALLQLDIELDRTGGAHTDQGLNQILIFEPRNSVGAGAAYERDTPSNLLNTRASVMSPIYGQPGHFLEWLHANADSWRSLYPELVIEAGVFLPRALFGIYLESCYQASVASFALKGVTVTHVREMVCSVKAVDAGYTVLAGSCEWAANAVLLAIGNHDCASWAALRDSPGYFASPYPCRELTRRIRQHESVCILGTSLSAVDAALALADAGHRGKVLMVSRNGRLPSVRANAVCNVTPQRLTRAAIAQIAAECEGHIPLDRVFELLLAELASASSDTDFSIDDILMSDDGPQRYLDRELAAAMDGDRAWQKIIYEMNSSVDLIWHCLSAADKARFDAEFKSRWLSYRVSFPSQNARRLQSLLHRDQVTVHKGFESVDIDPVSGKFLISVSDPARAFFARFQIDHLVNAAGSTSHVGRIEAPVVRDMLDSGLGVANAFGGFNLDFESSRLVDSTGSIQSNFYVAGSLASGTYFWTNAMEVNARLTQGIAFRLVDQFSTKGAMCEPVTP